MRNRLLAFIDRVRYKLRRRRADAEFDTEIAAHLALLVDEHVRRGVAPDEAARRARLEFGGVAQFTEAHRDRRGFPAVDSVVGDVRSAARRLAQRPGFVAGATLTLALGIGVNTAVYGLLHGFLRPLPVPDATQIVTLANERRGDPNAFLYTFSYPVLKDLRERAAVFSDLFGFSPQAGGLKHGNLVTSFFFSAVTDNFFSGLKLTPAAGHWFDPGGEHTRPDTPVVLGYAYWQKRFSGDLNAIGSKVQINGQPGTVVAVVPQAFHGLYAGTEMDGYVPFGSLARLEQDPAPDEYFQSRKTRWLTVLGRLKPGVSIEEAQAVADDVALAEERDHPETEDHRGIHVMHEWLARPFPQRTLANLIPAIRGFLLILAALVLLLACLNVANLVLVQATARQREMAVRAALGATRARLIRQSLTESLLLSTLGGGAGVLLGLMALRAFVAGIDIGTDFPMVIDASFDWRVFTYALIATVMTGLTVGVLPALRASRADASTMLHDAGRSNSGGIQRQRARRLLVISQVAGSLVLLIVAGLFVKRLDAAQHLDLGLDADRVLNVRIDPQHLGYNQERGTEFFRELARRVRSWPEVQSASLAFSAPMGYFNLSSAVIPEGRPMAAGETPKDAFFNVVGSSYFETLGIPLLRGRGFTDADDDETSRRVAIVNETLASRLWPGEDVVGRQFRLAGPDQPLWSIVGVARDSKYVMVFEDQRPYLYLPVGRGPGTLRVFQVRTAGPPAALAGRLAAEVRAIDPDMPVADLQTMRASLSGAMGFLMFKLGAYQAGVMGVLGLILAVVGVYGVVSFGAAQRTREIGIRIALGAHPRAVLSLMLRQGVVLILCGVAVGVTAAVVLTRIVSRFVSIAHGSDAATFAGIAALLAAIAVGACYVPARRATKVDPLAALRHE